MSLFAKIYARDTRIPHIVLGASLALVFIGVNFFVARGSVEHHCNPGIAFGIVLPQIAFVILWTVIMAIVVYLWLQATHAKEHYAKQCGLLLILAGGVANIADRILHGCVIDYIAIVPWNTFNLADTSIFIGAMLVLWHTWQENRRSKA